MPRENRDHKLMVAATRNPTMAPKYGAPFLLQRTTLLGLYYLDDAKGQLVYIGQSKRILNRLDGHADKPWANAFYRQVPGTLLNICESLEIRRYLPPFNKNLGPGAVVAGQLQQWWGSVPSIEFVLENHKPFAVLDLLSSMAGSIWMDEEGQIGIQLPGKHSHVDLAETIAFIEAGIMQQQLRCQNQG